MYLLADYGRGLWLYKTPLGLSGQNCSRSFQNLAAQAMRFNDRELSALMFSLAKNAENVGDEGNRVLLTTRQAHSEHRFRLVGPRLDVPAMGLGYLADDIQPESEVAVCVVFVPLFRASPERIKDPI